MKNARVISSQDEGAAMGSVERRRSALSKTVLRTSRVRWDGLPSSPPTDLLIHSRRTREATAGTSLSSGRPSARARRTQLPGLLPPLFV